MSDDNVVVLGAERSERSQDAKGWTPDELLRHLLATSDTSKLSSAVIICRVEAEDGGRYHWHVAGADVPEVVMMLEATKLEILS